MYNFIYEKVNTIEEVEKLLNENEETKILAGGQTLIPTMKQRFVHTHSYYTPTFTRKSESPVSTGSALLPSTASSTGTTTSSGGTYSTSTTSTSTTSSGGGGGGSSSGGGY